MMEFLVNLQEYWEDTKWRLKASKHIILQLFNTPKSIFKRDIIFMQLTCIRARSQVVTTIFVKNLIMRQMILREYSFIPNKARSKAFQFRVAHAYPLNK